MATGVQTWSQTAATNATADSNVNWAEGMAPSAVNDSARAEMSSVAKWRDDNSASLITSGSTTAFTLATNQVATALTSGYTVEFQFHASTDSSATLNVDGLGAKPLQVYPGTNLHANDFLANTRAAFVYTSTGTGQWISKGPPVHTVVFNTMSSSTVISTTTQTAGPSCSQGSTGTWLVMGSVTVFTTFSGGQFSLNLSDGTTTLASCVSAKASGANGGELTAALSGVMTNPAANLRLSAMMVVGTGTFMANDSGLGADSTITAVRLA